MTGELSSSERTQELLRLASLVQCGFPLVQPGPLGITSQPDDIGGRATLPVQKAGCTKCCQQRCTGNRWNPMPAGGRQNRTTKPMKSR